MAPPRVMSVALCKKTECVNKTCVNKCLHPLSLFFCEPMFALVLFWIRQVIWRVRDIKIPADNNWFSPLQFFAIGEKCRVPMLMAKRKAAQIRLGVGSVNIDDEEISELRRNYPAFCVRVAIAIIVTLYFFSICSGRPSIVEIGLVLAKMAVPPYPFFFAEFQYSS